MQNSRFVGINDKMLKYWMEGKSRDNCVGPLEVFSVGPFGVT